jgi:hypothetical protein
MIGPDPPPNNLMKFVFLGLGLWCLTPLSTIFKLYRGDQLYGGENEYTEKTIGYMKMSFTNLKDI